MREIKFRAWDIRNEVFWIWKLAKFANDGTVNHHYVFENNLGHWSEIGEVLNDPNYIIQQYTGLKDKKGVEIYEGDIVCRSRVSTGRGRDKYKIVEWKTPKRCGIGFNIRNTSGCIEVIGNIYETPELL